MLFCLKIIILPGVQCECEMQPLALRVEVFGIRVLKNGCI
jgi:hypothetical protein